MVKQTRLLAIWSLGLCNVVWPKFPTEEEYGDPEIQNEGDGPNVECSNDNNLITVSSIEETECLGRLSFSM